MLFDDSTVGKIGAVAQDLAALSRPEALLAFRQLGAKATTADQLEALRKGAGAGLAQLCAAGLARPIAGERRPDGLVWMVCGLTPRGRELWMGMREALR